MRISRCELCRLCLLAMEDPSVANLSFATEAFINSNWFSPFLSRRFGWYDDEKYVKNYYRTNLKACLKKDHILQFVACLLFEKMPTSWELAKKHPIPATPAEIEHLQRWARASRTYL